VTTSRVFCRGVRLYAHLVKTAVGYGGWGRMRSRANSCALLTENALAVVSSGQSENRSLHVLRAHGVGEFWKMDDADAVVVGAAAGGVAQDLFRAKDLSHPLWCVERL
jgi:hypothetical protein